MLIDVAKLVSAYHADVPDPAIAAQRVAFDRSFDDWHVLAIRQAICRYRKTHGIGGPLFLGIDTHALSAPACASTPGASPCDGAAKEAVGGAQATANHLDRIGR